MPLTEKARLYLARVAAKQAASEAEKPRQIKPTLDDWPSRYPKACIVFCPRKSGVAWMVRRLRQNVAEYQGPEGKTLAEHHRDRLLAELN